MKFIDYIEPHEIELNFPFQSKKRLFEQLADKMGADEKQARAIYDSLVKREKIGVTSLGNGVAIPHGQCLNDKEVKVHIFVLNKPVNYESIDGSKVQLIICIAFPKKTEKPHHQLLKHVGSIFKKHRIFREIINAENAQEIHEIILKESI